jgi:hypothetical protein
MKTRHEGEEENGAEALPNLSKKRPSKQLCINDNCHRFYQVHSYYIKRQPLMQPLLAAAMNSTCNGVTESLK